MIPNPATLVSLCYVYHPCTPGVHGYPAELHELWNDLRIRRVADNDYLVTHRKSSPPAQDPIFSATIQERFVREHVVGYCNISVGSAKNRDGTLVLLLHPSRSGVEEERRTEIMDFIIDYAFKSLALHRLSYIVYDGDEKTATWFQKHGFVTEGRKRKANWIDGKWYDEISLGILEEEWSAMQARKQETTGKKDV
ncbi:hypothetical protein OBBRIDRAFT_797967 [Obba rivulosa]|uniref:Acyl-CoA N-acyltransferase n=1 Tax=Obba rivulosa TaxID=1052685 RepID=A0A8E2AJF1_9APHY|nr:hypothetical protein OBBRIDRAFT_797967 [Obba rivulosa]